MDHHTDVNPNAGPVDSDHLGNPLILIHGVLMFVSYALMLPIGIVFGIRRHRYHVPWNGVAVLIALAGYFFGFIHHAYKGDHQDQDHMDSMSGESGDNVQAHDGMMHMDKRQAGDTSADHYGIKVSVHKTLGIFLFFMLLLQTGIGVYRKLAKTRSRLRTPWMMGPIPRNVHKYLGRAHLPLAYIQIVLGVVKLTEAAEGQYFGQAISHLVMGGSFWWYGCLYIAYLVNTFPTVRRPEYVESIVMTVWGVINFSILHQWGTRWSHSDLEHTSLGLLWTFGGAASLLIESRFNPLRAIIGCRNPMPALMIMLTGYAMSQHAQYFQFPTAVHTFFGYCLMLSGVCRLIQLALRPAPTETSPVPPSWRERSRSSSTVDVDDDATVHDEHGKSRFGPGETPVEGIARGETPTSAFFGFLSGFGIIESGLLFQSAHERQINWAMWYVPDPSVYILWFTCLAFASVFFLMCVLQAGRKSSGGSDSGTSPQVYNRLRTHVPSNERALSGHDIEMSGFFEDDHQEGQ